jgi:hypothetical protein
MLFKVFEIWGSLGALLLERAHAEWGVRHAALEARMEYVERFFGRIDGTYSNVERYHDQLARLAKEPRLRNLVQPAFGQFSFVAVLFESNKDQNC